MTKENDAHSGANPEPTADLETDTSLAPAIDNTTDDDATREIIRPETISAPASEPDGDEDDECDEYIDPGYTVVYDRIKDAFVHVPKNAEPAGAMPVEAAPAPEPTPEDSAPVASSTKKAPIPFAPSTLVIPSGTLPLIEAQLAEALKIMDTFNRYIAHPHAPIRDCMEVSDCVSKLTLASANLATVAVRLQNGDPESRHRVIVEYADPQGGGVRQARKRLSHGRG